MLDETRRSLAAIRNGKIVVVLAVDLDDFDDLLVACGDATGQIILSELAQRLVDRLFPDRFSVCLEGTRYVLMAEVVGGPDSVQSFLEKVQRCFDEPVVAASTSYRVAARIGVTFSTRKSDDAHLLLGAAEVASSRARKTGAADPVVFDRDSRSRVHEDFERAQALHDAIAKDELLLRYQPIVDLQRQEPIGLGSDLGWVPLNADMMSNHELLGCAEQHGLLVELSDWVLRAFVAQWTSAPPEDKGASLSVMIRLTGQQLSSWLARSSDRLSLARGTVPGRLSIEILDDHTRRGVLDEESLEWLHRLGIGVVIDAFGGLPLLTRLRAASIEALRLSTGLIHQVDQSARQRTLVARLIDLAHEFGVSTIADGVRDQAQIETLAGLGCDQVHSYFVSGPLSLDEAVASFG